MKAVKGNKVYTIEEQQKKFYQDAGFDIKDEEGKTIAYGRGKTVPYGDYAALEDKNKALEEENEALSAKVAELETLLVEAKGMTSEDAAELEKKSTKKA